ncbi:MAG: hypothetical protein K0U84_22030, partial [Actinomycetia bacterium]|nr:hypothetical protein [Actinomycetes bacterium]
LSLSQIQGWDVQHLEDAAQRWDSTAQLWEDCFESVHRGSLNPGGSVWEGDAAEAVQERTFADLVKVRGLADVLREASSVARWGASDLLYAQQAVLAAVEAAQAAGFTVGEDLSVSDPTPLASLLRGGRQAQAEELADYISFRAQALKALDTDVATKITTITAPLHEVSFNEAPVDNPTNHIQALDNETRERDARHPDGRERDPDGQDGRRVREDEVFRRPPGGSGEGTDFFESDWAGRAILERYLLGGGEDWHINDDPEWTRYMTAHPGLARELDGHVRAQAEQSLNEYLSGAGAQRDYSAQFRAELQNGESITGYQYLNGTNDLAGGFKIDGTTHVEDLADGNYRVTVDGGYQWNDIIDPNYQYSTDTFKNRIAELFTLGQAEDYQIHIGWHSPTELIFDQNGALISAKGYPYQ